MKEGEGVGVITFIQRGIQYREVKKGDDLEYINVEVWLNEGNITIMNIYNPCKRLELEQLEEMWRDIKGKVVWCGDFNAHSTLWEIGMMTMEGP